MNNYKQGLLAGIPIALGYLSVSFTFGIMAVSFGLSWWQAVLISMTTVTSAGQFAGIGIMIHPGQYIQMLISQITINVRYSFMSISIGQKADSRFRGIYRWLLGFFITDEIFAVATKEDEIKRSYFAGLATLPYFGWALGTFIGAILGNVLPDRLMSALSVAIYGMFVAVRIDTNTAETFRHGVWYAKDDVKQRLNIVPLTLAQFQKYFVAMFEADKATPQTLCELLLECEAQRDILEAPSWKQYIGELVEKKAYQLKTAV